MSFKSSINDYKPSEILKKTSIERIEKNESDGFEMSYTVWISNDLQEKIDDEINQIIEENRPKILKYFNEITEKGSRNVGNWCTKKLIEKVNAMQILGLEPIGKYKISNLLYEAFAEYFEMKTGENLYTA